MPKSLKETELVKSWMFWVWDISIWWFCCQLLGENDQTKIEFPINLEKAFYIVQPIAISRTSTIKREVVKFMGLNKKCVLPVFRSAP